MITIAQALTAAEQCYQAGDLDAAESLLRQILEAAPGQAEALRLLSVLAQTHNTRGNAQKNLGQLDQALASYRLALRSSPSNAGIHLNLSNTLRALRKPAEAAAHARIAVQSQPLLAEAHYELGAALQELGEPAEAAPVLRQAVRLRPQFAEALNRLGLALHGQGRMEEAVAMFQEAVRSRRNYPEAHYNLGNAYRIMGKRPQAAACYQETLRLQPDCGEAYYSLGGLAADQEHLEQAVAYFEQALRLRPDLADAHGAVGVARAEQGRLEEATACLEKALRLKPTTWLRIVLATRLPVIYQSMAELESWRDHLTREIRRLRSEGIVHDLTAEPAVNLFYLAYQGRNDRDILREAAGLYSAPPETDEVSRQRKSPGLKIKIGFLSSFFRAHTIGHWMRGLVAHLSRDHFDVTVLSVGSHQDEIAAFFRQHADRHLEIPKHLPWARRVIADQKLDVLIFADVGMDPTTSTLAYSRLAPVQCVTLGHPVTTGLDTIDYFISTQDLETDESEQHYTETLVRLKTLPIYYYRPVLQSALKDKQHFGLANKDHIYACTQTSFKFHPEFDAILGGILRRDPQGRLVLAKALRPHWDELLRRRFAATLPDVMDRILFLPRLDFQDYLHLLAVSDVLLDTIHFGGGSTSYEGLAVGTPIVTMPSRLLRGRITFALYKQMDVLDCVVKSPEEYIDMALRLGTDAGYREAMRRKILAANDVLYENSQGIRELEQFLLSLR